MSGTIGKDRRAKRLPVEQIVRLERLVGVNTAPLKPCGATPLRPRVRVARASSRDTAPSHGCGDVDVRAGNLLIALLAAQLCLYFCATRVGEPGFAWSRG